MDPVEILTMSGGVSGRDLLAASGRHAVRRAVEAGRVVRVGRARYALPSVAALARCRARAGGCALARERCPLVGLEVPERPGDVDVVVPRDRHPRPAPGARVRRRDLAAHDVVPPGVTTPLRTVLDVAADARADNPFESVLRGLAIEAGLDVVPQVSPSTGERWVRPDLLDAGRGLAIEAESFTWHGNRAQLVHDCHKYNDLTLMGPAVVRFAWEQVMLDRSYTRSVLAACAGLGRTPRWVA